MARGSWSIFAIVISAIAFHGTAAVAGDEPIRFDTTGFTVIAKASDKKIDVGVGDTPLDRPHSFRCRSAAGCMVILSIDVSEFRTVNESTCAYIDGADVAKPACQVDFVSPIVRRSVAKIGPGMHTLQTLVRTGTAGGQVTSWEVDYSIYERN